MSLELIPDSVRRFVLTSIPTVPHLEALLLLWREPARDWAAVDVAARLYVAESVAAALLTDLFDAGLIVRADDPAEFRARREPATLSALLDEVGAVYSTQLRAVSALIHSNVDRKGARFAQAFNWRKE